jgi:adenine-specific DNA-methyltransferase
MNDMKQSINGYFFKPNYKVPNSRSGKWLHAFLSPDELEVYEKILSHPSVYNFETIAQVDVGIVTGANSFFLVNNDTVKKYKLQKWAKPMFGRSELVRGVIYDDSEHDLNSNTGLPTNFLHFNVQNFNELNANAQEYIRTGEKLNLHTRYKCRIREPWFKVPSVSATSLGMLKRAHDIPRLVYNKIEALTTDTAYRIKVKKFTPEILAFSFVNSFTALTAELEGRHYGGGVLELVPSEIENLTMPIPEKANINLNNLHKLFLKKVPVTEILKIQDKIILGSLGFTEQEQNIIFGAWLNNKFYLLRSLRCRSSSGARPLRSEDRGQRASGTLVLPFAASCSGHILTCHEDMPSQNVR